MNFFGSLCITLLFLVSTACFAWELEKDQNGIRIYTQEIKGSSFNAFRAETTLDAPLKTIVSHQLDVEAMSEWLHNCLESKVKERLSNSEYIAYQRIEAPWPFSDRDYMYKSKITQDESTFIVTISFNAIAEINEHDDEYVQVTQLHGFWRFTPKTDGQVFIEYETHADPGGDIPAWIANTFVVDQPFGTLINFKKRVSNHKLKESIDLSFMHTPTWKTIKASGE